MDTRRRTRRLKHAAVEQRISETHQERRERMYQRLPAAFLEGAEGDSRRRLGRGLTAEELERVLWRYPGDVPERCSR